MMFPLDHGVMAAAEGGSDGQYAVTVAPGTVGSDLVSFPLMVDLSDMPAAFWEDVNETGGNVRVYASDGVTLVPHDVTFIDKRWSIGRLFAKTTITTAGGAQIRVALVGAEEAALAATDANGRNAVWGDYEVVWCFPETVNRTGKGHPQTVPDLPPVFWTPGNVIAAEGAPHQGLATDGQGTFVTVDTDRLRKCGSDLLTVLENTTPLADTGIGGVNHLGDPCIIDDEIFVPAEEYPSGSYTNQHIAVFSLSDLSFLRSYDVSAQGHECSSIAYDGEYLYITSYDDGSTIWRYSVTGQFIDTVAMSPVLYQAQGIEFVDGDLFISQTVPGENRGAIYAYTRAGTQIGRITDPISNPTPEGLCYDGTRVWWMDVGGNVELWGRNLNAYDWGSFYDGLKAFSTFAAGTAWTASASVIYPHESGYAQNAFLSVTAEGSSSSGSRATLVQSSSADKVGIWNSSNGWAYGAEGITNYQEKRLAFSHNEMSGRKLWVNGVAEVDLASSALRPSSQPTDFVVNGGYRGDSTEEGSSYFQFVWYRSEAVSDAWMAADAANANDPASFYTVSTLNG